MGLEIVKKIFRIGGEINVRFLVIWCRLSGCVAEAVSFNTVHFFSEGNLSALGNKQLFILVCYIYDGNQA